MKEEINTLQSRIYAAKERLRDLIKSLPDEAEGVQRISKNCCIVPFSVIGKNKGILSPTYYLSHESKQALLEMIDSSRSLETLIFNVETVLETGQLKDGTKIAPNVLKSFKELWES